MNNPVEAAKARLAAIAEEAEKLRLFIAAYENVADLLDVSHIRPAGESKSVDNLVEVPASENRRMPKAVNPPASVLVPAVIDILRTRGHPLSRRGIYEALKARDLVIQGADPVKALGTILWRNQDEIIQLEGYGYWPRALAYSRAEYPGLPPARGPQEPARFR